MTRFEDKMTMYRIADNGNATRLDIGYNLSNFYDEVWMAEGYGWHYIIVRDSTGEIVAHN